HEEAHDPEEEHRQADEPEDGGPPRAERPCELDAVRPDPHRLVAGAGDGADEELGGGPGPQPGARDDLVHWHSRARHSASLSRIPLPRRAPTRPEPGLPTSSGGQPSPRGSVRTNVRARLSTSTSTPRGPDRPMGRTSLDESGV